jgi:hypothetical protein
MTPPLRGILKRGIIEMKNREPLKMLFKASKLLSLALLCLLLVLTATACFSGSGNDPDPTPPPDTEPRPTPPPPVPTTEPEPEPVVLVPYDGVVEHIFFHEVIAYPELAFNGGSNQRGYDNNMVTVHEYKKILESLHKNNFILVDLNDVWSEFTNENGHRRMRRNTLMLPEGKKPLVISYDDLSFYAYMQGDGFMDRYIVGSDGEIWAEGVDPNGNRVVSQDLAAITILDKFIRNNPDFSHEGAKGCLALTGYEGILGYRTHTDKDDNSQEFRLNRMKEVARAKPVVQRLHETGWYFATHSFGHINLERMSLQGVKDDLTRWLDEVGSLVGETKIFIYPFGSRLDGGDVYDTGPALRHYIDNGFRIFASVGREPFSRIKPDVPAVVLDRMNSDGITLRRARDRFMRFYDAKEVFDPMRPTEYETLWD